MRRGVLTLLLAACMAVLPAAAQEAAAPEVSGHFLPMTPEAEKPGSIHRFWDTTNLRLFAAVAAGRSLDYASTRNMLARGREEILLPDDVVNNSAGFVALEAAGAATSIGLSYLLHRTGHHRLEHWLSIGHAGVATFGAGRNYALKSFPRAR